MLKACFRKHGGGAEIILSFSRLVVPTENFVAISRPRQFEYVLAGRSSKKWNKEQKLLEKKESYLGKRKFGIDGLIPLKRTVIY